MISDSYLANLAHATYQEPPTWFYEDVHACLTQTDEYQIIAFRGSKSVEDWIRDFSAWPRLHHKIGYCHNGFLTGIEAIQNQVLSQLNDKKIIVIGHSLGGALALILSAILIIHNRIPEKVVTFGAPKPGFHKLKKILSRIPEISQYHNGNDPVPTLPVTLFWWPYTHPTKLIPIGYPSGISVEDHFMKNYIKSLGDFNSFS